MVQAFAVIDIIVVNVVIVAFIIVAFVIAEEQVSIKEPYSYIDFIVDCHSNYSKMELITNTREVAFATMQMDPQNFAMVTTM